MSEQELARIPDAQLRDRLPALLYYEELARRVERRGRFQRWLGRL